MEYDDTASTQFQFFSALTANKQTFASLLSYTLQYHISKVSQSEPQMMSSNAAMDDLESALQSLEVKMEGESSASEMLVRHIGCTCLLLSVSYCQDWREGTSPPILTAVAEIDSTWYFALNPHPQVNVSLFFYGWSYVIIKWGFFL